MIIPSKKAGHSLFAREVGALADTMRRSEATRSGSGVTSLRCHSFMAMGSHPQWEQKIVQVVGYVTDDDGLPLDGLYTIYYRFYGEGPESTSSDPSTWQLDAGQLWQMDASDLGVTFQPGDKVVAYWDEQRAMFVPCYVGRRLRYCNRSSLTAPPYAVLAVTGWEQDDLGWFFNITQPTTAMARFHLVNTGVDVDPYDDELGVSGMGFCHDGSEGALQVLIDPNTGPTFGESWGPTPDEWYLSRYYPALFDPFGVVDTTNHVAVGWFHQIDKLIGKLSGTLNQGSSATMNVWGGVPGSEADLGMTLTVHDWLLAYGVSAIPNGSKVMVDWRNGIPYLTEASC